MYQRPRGDITTVLDLTDRDAQDNTYFPLDAEGSWFHSEARTTHPTTLSIQEFAQRGPAEWGGRFSFEIGSLATMGDLLQSVMLQIRLGHWYDASVLYALARGEITTDVGVGGVGGYSEDYWTFCNSLGTVIIDHADLVVNEQLIERITGEWCRVWQTLGMDRGSAVGVAADAVGFVAPRRLSRPEVLGTAFHPRRPYPVEDGLYQCVLPFFFLRGGLTETFPLLSCHEGSVRIDVQLRPFEDVVRRFVGWRAGCSDVPLGRAVRFVSTSIGGSEVVAQTSAVRPAFRDFRIVTASVLLGAEMRRKFLRRPFEQLVRLLQTFSFEEPLKYLVSKANGVAGDVVDIQLPLELNHPVVELVWVLRRRGVRENNEWANFTPVLERESAGSGAGRVFPSWLVEATVRVNGSEVVRADGDWFREQVAGIHSGGVRAWDAGVYGYSFSRNPESHQPSGSANMSRATSVTLGMRVRTPIAASMPAVGPAADGGWEVFVFAVHYQWLRFQNGLCSRIFAD
jgi:hypothetical protein